MNNLEKICDVLGLKRSRTEREIAVLKNRLLALDMKISTLEVRKGHMNDAVFLGEISPDDPVGDALRLGRWQEAVYYKVQGLQAEKKTILDVLRLEQQALKEILIKEDIIKARAKAARHKDEQTRLESESSTRLENWVLRPPRFL